MMDSSCDNVNDINSELMHDLSKRYANPDSPIQTIQDMMNAISAARFARKDLMATATIDQLTNRIQLLTTSNSKANLKHLYGYDDQGNTYLNPEEALYLLETGKLEICINGIPISIIKARALLLNGCSTWLSAERRYDGTTCTDEEYAVYKYLASHGYRLRRCQRSSDPIIRSTAPSTATYTYIQDTTKMVHKEKIDVIELGDDVEMKSSSEEGLQNNKESRQVVKELDPLSPKNFSDDTTCSQYRGLKRKRMGVDNQLSSSSNNNESCSASPPVKNWKQWRQHFVQEAHEVFKTSLLGGGLGDQGNPSTVNNERIFSDDVVERLNLWQKRPTEKEEENIELNCIGDHNNMDSCGSGDDKFTFYLFAPTDKKVHRIKLGSAVKPTRRILIARNADLVPDIAAISQRDSEHIPILIALVQDDCEVTFVATDFTPVTSLF